MGADGLRLTKERKQKVNQPSDTLTALIAEHGFREVIEELRKYSLQSEEEIGLPEELSAYWRQVGEHLEQIL